ERAAHPRLDGAARVEQILLHRALERRAVEVALAEVLLPGVAVRVQLDEAERPVAAREDAQLGQRDRVVAAERERECVRVDERTVRRACHGFTVTGWTCWFGTYASRGSSSTSRSRAGGSSGSGRRSIWMRSA